MVGDLLRRVGPVMLFMGIVCVGWLLGHLYRPGILPRCAIHDATGWLCPGCGGSRALAHLAAGEFDLSLRSNALVVVSLVLLATHTSLVTLERSSGKVTSPRKLARLQVALIVLVVLSAAYVMLRNVPLLPFLAPPS